MNRVDFVYANGRSGYYKNNQRLSRVEISKITSRDINLKNVSAYKKNNNIIIKSDGTAIVISDLSSFLSDSNVYNKYKEKIVSILMDKRKKPIKKKIVNRSKSYGAVLKVSSVLTTSILATLLLTQPVGENIESLYTPEEIKEVVIDEEIDTIQADSVIAEEPKSFDIEYESRIESDDYIYTKENYADKIAFYAEKYGLDKDLMLAVATQESSGRHNNTADNYYSGVGLMQVEYQVYVDEELKAYKQNDETGEFERINYLVTDEKIKNIDTNIEIGCIEMQNCLEYTNYNIPLAIQMYNMGYGNVYSFLEDYANDTNKSIDEILENNYDNGWLDYRCIGCGDSKYLEHILSYTDGNITCVNPKTNEQINVVFNEQNIMQR